MKAFVKISTALLATLTAGSLFLNDFTFNKNQQQNENGKQSLTSTPDTIIFSIENIGLSDYEFNRFLNINLEDNSDIIFEKEVFRYPEDRHIIQFNGTDDNNFCFYFEYCNDTLRNETMDSCDSQIITQNIIELPNDPMNNCIDDTAYIKNK